MTHQAPDDDMYDITPSAAIFAEMDTALCLMRWRSLELEEAVARRELTRVPGMVDGLDRAAESALRAYGAIDRRGMCDTPPRPLSEVMAYGFLMSALKAALRHSGKACKSRFEGDDTGAAAASQAYWAAVDMALRAHAELADRGIIDVLCARPSTEGAA